MSETNAGVGGRSKSACKMLLVGFLLGVLASFLVLVILAFKYGPQGESHTVDLYSGHIITYKHFLWRSSQAPGPRPPYVQWAIEHQDPIRSWYVVSSSISRAKWFGSRLAVDFTTREYVYAIYSLQMPEEEKVELLHRYHEDLDALKLKQADYAKSHDFMRKLTEEWEQRLESIENRETEQ